MENKCNEERQRVINEGLSDVLKLYQPPFAPDLCLGIKIQYTFRYTDTLGNDKIIDWYIGIRNTRNGLKYYKKGSDIGVQWDTNKSKKEDTSYSIVKLKEILINYYNKFN